MSTQRRYPASLKKTPPMSAVDDETSMPLPHHHSAAEALSPLRSQEGDGTNKPNGFQKNNSNNGSGHHDKALKKQRTTKRSCVDYGRLCLLRNRGVKCWLWAFVLLVSTYTIVTRFQQPKHPLQLEKQFLRVVEDVRYKPEDRKLFNGFVYEEPSGDKKTTQVKKDEIQNKSNNNNNQKDTLPPTVSVVDLTQWKPLSGQQLFQRAKFEAKPLVMGFLLVPEKGGSSNYNINKRHSYQLQKLQFPPPPRDYAFKPEKFQIVRISHQDHTIFEDVTDIDTTASETKSNAESKGQAKQPNNKDSEDNADNNKKGDKNIHWTFENSLVREIGNGVEEQIQIRDNSKDYLRYKADPLTPGCEPQYEWQTKSFPNCNDVHQMDILTRIRTLNPAGEVEGILLAQGGYRDVWMMEHNDQIHDDSEVVAMKTLLFEHPWTERNMDRHRRDALATDRLTGSPYALNLFGYCANTGIYEFADGGDLGDAVDNEEGWPTWDSAKKFKYVYQVAAAIADTHNIDKEGFPSMTHTDISMSQFVSTNGGEDYQINDFNRARFLYRDVKDHNKICKFEVGSNKGKFRSPEEYEYDPEDEKVDVYSMGNIFYVLLTGKYPWEKLSTDQAKEAVIAGKRPEIDSQYLDSEDPLIQAIVKAIEGCWKHKPEERATSRAIEQLLRPLATAKESAPPKKA